jgi:hypothetical protein
MAKKKCVDEEKEIFTIETKDEKGKKKNKEVVTTICNPTKHATKDQIREYNKIILWILGIAGLIFLLFFVIYLVSYNLQNPSYKGIIDFKIVDEGPVRFYYTYFNTSSGAQRVKYNVFLRTNPNELEKIPVQGELFVENPIALNIQDEFICDGKGQIAIANLIQVLNAGKINVAVDKDAQCDELSRYVLINILPGEKTEIIQTGDKCYDFYVKDCEILEVTERYIVEFLYQLELFRRSRN